MTDKIRLFYTITQDSIILFSLICSIIFWKNIRHSYLKNFPFYTAFSIIVALTWYIKSVHFIGRTCQNVFVAFEFFTFYNFYLHVFRDNKIYKIILNILIVIFATAQIIIPIALYCNANKASATVALLNNVFTELIVIENILIAVPALIYYRSLFFPPFINNLSTNYIFLAMSGILFCFAISIPVFLFQRILLPQNKQLYMSVYMINSFGYITMHLFFIRAYLNIRNV